MTHQHPDAGTTAPQPTAALPTDPDLAPAAAVIDIERASGTGLSGDGFGAWPGFPFPPPLMGLSWQTVHAAAAHWLRTLADLLETDEINLNILFATGPIISTCQAFGLPTANAGRVVSAAALYTLGALSPQPTLTALCAAPAALHPARLRQAADTLEQ